MAIPGLPPQFKALGHYMKIASEHETRDPVIAYWCRFHTVQQGLQLDKTSPEAKTFLFGLLDWLESRKKDLGSDESITNESTAEAYLEEYILKIFNWADGQDRAGVFNKNVVKAFYTSGILTDILANFNNGEIPDEFKQISKYAKWKASYIHNCLKNGDTPIPGPMGDPDSSEDPMIGGGHNQIGFTSPPGMSMNYPNPSRNPGPSSSSSTSVAPAAPPAVAPPSVVAPAPQQPIEPTPAAIAIPSPTGVHLNMAEIAKAQKYCKWAGSALDYEDINTAITNLEKALRLLRTGKDE